MMASLEDQTVDGAMFLSHMRMDMREQDALTSVMTHGTVVINMILLLAVQVGLVIPQLENVLWPIQEMDLVANPLVKTIANHNQDQIHIDVMLQAIHVIHVNLLTQDVAQIEHQNVKTVKIQILQILLHSTDATRPILSTHSAKNAILNLKTLVVDHKHQFAKVAIHQQNSLHVMKKHSHASNLITQVILNRLVTQVVDILHH
jgi:hypothetical protein